MEPDIRFKNKDNSFWGAVRLISQENGYTKRGEGQVKIPTVHEIYKCFETLGLNKQFILDEKLSPTKIAQDLLDYFTYRANILNAYVEPRLMDKERARECYQELFDKLKPKCPIPMNKQKGEKSAPNYFTALINMIIEHNLEGLECNFNPRELTTVTKDGFPLRTLSRQVDGAFPNPVNPLAIWEIKEYYYTTTFGSRVADGVYESLLDGMELKELNEHENIKIFHYLMVDSHYTWWECGRSYLCRIIDMLNMGYVDEVLFGYEVVEKLPSIVSRWKQ